MYKCKNIYLVSAYLLECPFNRISIAHYIGSIYWPNECLDPKYLEIWCSRFSGNWVQSLQISLINEKLFLPHLIVQFSTFLFLKIREVASVKVFLSKILNFGPTSMKFHPISWNFFVDPNWDPKVQRFLITFKSQILGPY